ncbi:hypothetical protein GW17_00046102 [Ensete ventricosum]|nr:hypothetical protein GW17_00046102 [Ensete ventricosum]
MLGAEMHEEAPPAPQQPLSPMGEACSRMDLTAIHEILVKTHYRDDEVTNEMRDMLEARKRGDFAFRDKDFKTAIECYSQFLDVGTMVSPTVYARRSLCHLLCDQADAALRDAMQAQCLYPDWPTAFYMQAVALAKLNMPHCHDMDGSWLSADDILDSDRCVGNGGKRRVARELDPRKRGELVVAVEGEVKGEGWKVRSEVDGDDEGTAEQEHLVAAEVPPRHAEGHEEDDARRQSAYWRRRRGPHRRRERDPLQRIPELMI